MTITATVEDFAARLRAEADDHDRIAEQTADRFQAAAYRGLAEDLRARADGVLNETEAARRAAQERAEHEAQVAAAAAVHADAVTCYERAAGMARGLVEAAVAEVLAIVRQLHEHAQTVTDAAAEAAATGRTLAGYGAHCEPVPDFQETILRDLMAEAPSLARCWSGARRSPASAAEMIAARIAELEFRR